jgi:lysophospholipase L1-like esterase
MPHIHDALRPVLRAVGDCNTRGAEQLPASDCLPARLAQALREQGTAYHVDNLGATMNTSREGVNRLSDCTAPAAVLLINFGLVDAWVTSAPWCYVPYYPDNVARKWARKTLKSLKRRLRSGWVRRLIGAGPVVPLREFRVNVGKMIDIERARSPHVQVVLWNSVPTQGNPDRNLMLTRYNDSLREIARQKDCLFFDAAAEIAQLPAEQAFLDEVHLTGAGAEHLARSLTRLFTPAAALAARRAA